MNSPTVGLIILAAGASTRMGTPKQLLTYRGHSFVRHIAEIASASICQPITIVLGAYGERIKPELNHLPLQIVENPQWNQGMSSSIQVGIEALNAVSQNLDAVVITLCDQPLISSQLLNQIVDSYYFTNKLIIACEYAKTLGVPALFSRSLFAELLDLQSTEGAKKIIQKYNDQVFSIPFLEGAIDIDTPKEYEELQALIKSSL